MTKLHITQKAAKNSNYVVLAVPYCFLQHALNYESPRSYNAGVDGWNFDLYEINETYSVVTGYRGMSRSSTHELINYPELRAALEKLDQESTNPDFLRADRKQKLIEILGLHLAAK